MQRNITSSHLKALFHSFINFDHLMNYPIPMYCIHKSVEKLIAPVSTQELLFNFPTQVYLVLLCGYIQKK